MVLIGLQLFVFLNHAFLKALLLSAGSLVHSLGDKHDMHKFGEFQGAMSVTYVCILVGLKLWGWSQYMWV